MRSLAKEIESRFKSSRLRQYDLKTDSKDGKIILCGMVGSFYHKQVAQEIAVALLRKTPGRSSEDVENQIEVLEPAKQKGFSVVS